MLIDKWLDFCYEHVWSEVVIFYWVFMTFLHWQDETDPDVEMILSDKTDWNNPIPKFNNSLFRLKTKEISFLIQGGD